MAQLGQRFNAQEHNTEQRDFEDLPNGIYKLEIESSDVKKGDNGTGLNTTMIVIEPESHKGRKLFNFYNLEHKNSQAPEIGQRQVASLGREIGVDSVDDSDELHFQSFTVKVGMGKPSKDGQYPARAEIKRYFFPDEGNVPDPEIDANQPAPVARAQAPANDNRQASKPAGGAAAAGGTRRPWGSK